jgi:hypothetical protein
MVIGCGAGIAIAPGCAARANAAATTAQTRFRQTRGIRHMPANYASSMPVSMPTAPQAAAGLPVRAQAAIWRFCALLQTCLEFESTVSKQNSGFDFFLNRDDAKTRTSRSS